MTASATKPLPDPALPSLAPYWAGLERGMLLLPQCATCTQFAWPPRSRCLSCGRHAFDWARVSDEATIFSWTTVFRSFLPGFEQDTPYTVGIVELVHARPVRMLGRIVEARISDLRVLMPLRAVMERSSPTVTLCNWAPASR